MRTRVSSALQNRILSVTALQFVVPTEDPIEERDFCFTCTQSLSDGEDELLSLPTSLRHFQRSQSDPCSKVTRAGGCGARSRIPKVIVPKWFVRRGC